LGYVHEGFHPREFFAKGRFQESEGAGNLASEKKAFDSIFLENRGYCPGNRASDASECLKCSLVSAARKFCDILDRGRSLSAESLKCAEKPPF